MAKKESKPNKYERYVHHSGQVFVRSDLKGKHHELSLCPDCGVTDCRIKAEVYRNQVKFNISTPVQECPQFKEKEETSETEKEEKEESKSTEAGDNST